MRRQPAEKATTWAEYVDRILREEEEEPESLLDRVEVLNNRVGLLESRVAVLEQRPYD